MKYRATTLFIAALQVIHSVSTLRHWNEPSHHKMLKNDNEVTNLKIKYGGSNLRDHLNLEIKTIAKNPGAPKKLSRDFHYYYNWHRLENYQPHHRFESQYYRTRPASDFSLRNYDEIYVNNQADVPQRTLDPSIPRTYNLKHEINQVLRHQPTKNDYDHYIPSNGNITVTDYPALGNSPTNEGDFHQHPSDHNKADTDSFEVDENYMVLGPYEQLPRKVSKEENGSPSKVNESSKIQKQKNISSPSDFEEYDMDLYHDGVTQFSHEDFNHLNKSVIHNYHHFGSSKTKYNNVSGVDLGWPEIYSHSKQKTPYHPHLDPYKQTVSSQYYPPPNNPYPYQVPPGNIYNHNPHHSYPPQPPQLSQVSQGPDPFNLYQQPPNQNIVQYNPYDPAPNIHDNMYRPLDPYTLPNNAHYQPLTPPLSNALNLSPNINTDEDDCEYGTSWTMNCYHCVCNGSTATCIRDNNCKPLPSHVQDEPKLCKPFSNFPLDGSDCHRCQCTADGIPLCTFDYYACSRKIKQRFYKVQGENTLKIGPSLLNDSLSTTTMTCPALLMYFNVWKCQPGSRWTARCFNCACDDFGQPICYRIVGCTPAPLSMPPKCRPGTTIPMKDCIDCYCDDDGFPAGQLPPPKSSGLSGAGAIIKEKESSESIENSDAGVDSAEVIK